jgi:ferritin
MIKPKVVAALNKQLQQELAASYGYLSLSVWFEQQVLKGFAAFFLKQAQEEREHAMKILEYIQDTGGAVTLGGIEAPRQKFGSVLEAVQQAQTAERNNTASINEVYQIAQKENDLATQQMLDWFIKEQVEEEKWADELVTLAEKAGDHVGALFMLDNRLARQAKDEG